MDGTDLLTEMKAYVTDEAAAAAEADAENALPFESIDDYSTDPASFSEMSLKMMDVVETVFDLAAVYNRRSPEYLKSCAQLERGIRYLGSCCLTKVALETKQYPLPELGQLSTDKLYGMASFHFRKLDRALHEYIDEKHAVDDDLLDMEYRFFHLLLRLRSTEVKIYTYDFRRCFETEDYKPLVNGLAFSKDTCNRGAHDRTKVAPAFHRAPAFPLKAESAAALPNQKSEIRNQKCSAQSDAPQEQGTRSKGQEASQGSGESANAEFGMRNSEMVRCEQRRDQDSEARSAAPQEQGTRSKGQEEIGMSAEPTSDCNNSAFRIPNSAFDIAELPTTNHQPPNEVRDEDDGLLAAIEIIRRDPKAPKYMRVLGDVMERSAGSGEGGPVFTPEEASFLSSDPEFRKFDPELARALREARSASRVNSE